MILFDISDSATKSKDGGILWTSFKLWSILLFFQEACVSQNLALHKNLWMTGNEINNKQAKFACSPPMTQLKG
jgi:hypothetical protein